MLHRAGEALSAAAEGLSQTEVRCLRRGKNTKQLLYVSLATVNGMEIGAHECGYAIFLQFGIKPPDLPLNCNGYGVRIFIVHALDYKKGILVTSRYNDIPNRAADMSSTDLTPIHVRYDPLINLGHSV